MANFLSILFASVALSTAVYGEMPEELEVQNDEILLIDFVDIRDAKAEELLNIMEGKMKNLALHFPEGSILPIKPKLSGEFLELVGEVPELNIHIKRDFYVRCNAGSLLVSSDLKEWKDLGQFVTGNIYAGLVKEESDPVFAVLEAQINERR